ncbi:MAG TPA: hypothetical protein VET66_07090 [Steroidobacteraceae bacterium]|nr:hypothetical protein [Steroidobacteraceae bacterium]
MKLTVTRVGTALAAALLFPALAAATDAAPHSARVTQQPLVMRLSKDEFRIAFGIDVPGCAAHGCSGQIRYRIAWRTEDGTLIAETKRVTYRVPANYGRTMIVDWQYLDTAEGAHTTEVVGVTVKRITCESGAGTRL